MSSIASRGVLAATRRQASSIRQKVRSCEPHAYHRIAMGEIAAPAYGKLIKNVSTRVFFFGPAAFLVLGWPWIGEKVLNGHVRGGGHAKVETL